MKITTETILVIFKYLSLIAGIGFSIECGSELLYFISSFIDTAWSEKVYGAEKAWSGIREYSTWYYVCVMSLVISISALKAWIWYLMFGLLQKLQLKSPFSMSVTNKIGTIAHLLLGVWILMSIMGRTYGYYLVNATGITLPAKYTGDEYFFMAGIVYIISKIFMRGIEMQEENQLTV